MSVRRCSTITAVGARPLLRADRTGRRPSLGRMLTHPVWTAADWTLWSARGAVVVVGWLDWEHRRAAAWLGCLAVVVVLAARRVLIDYRPGCGRCRDRGYVVHRCRPDCAGCTRGIDPCIDCRRPVPAEPTVFGELRRAGASR